MKLFKLDLVSKNNAQRGTYFYYPIVEIDGKYYWCESLVTTHVLKPKDVDITTLVVKREIPIEFYQANGIK